MHSPVPMRKTWDGTKGQLSEELRQSLRSSQVASALDGTLFVPISDLTRLIVPQTVEGILDDLDPAPKTSTSRSELAVAVCLKAPRLVALLVWIGQPQIILTIDAQDLDDGNIPLSNDTENSVLAKCRASSSWTGDCEARILREQWMFLAPVFYKEGHVMSSVFPPPLPLIHMSRAKKESVNSTVSQVQIHPSHLQFPGGGVVLDKKTTPPLLALKLFKGRGKKRFEHEVRVLRAIHRHRPCLNVVRLVLGFSAQRSYGIVFPWAECDLSELMEREPPLAGQSELGRWIVQQFIHLLDGLAVVHGGITSTHRDRDPNSLLGRHGDLRPANILLMRSLDPDPDPASDELSGQSQTSPPILSCRLQIASMAMTDLFEDEAHQTIPSETGTYQGPEAHLEIAIGPLYDIWSLGCVFLELIIWSIEGPRGLKAFGDARNSPDSMFGERVWDDYFFTLQAANGVYTGAVVRPSVISRIQALQQDERLGYFLGGALDIVRSDMLLPVGGQRLCAQGLLGRFRVLLGE